MCVTQMPQFEFFLSHCGKRIRGRLSREGKMDPVIIQDFATITAHVVGDLDVIAPDAEPNPWFCKDIFRKRDLQWAGYIGDFSLQKHALVFGVNLEFIPAWRRAYIKIKEDFAYFSQLLGKHRNFEWHWMRRPGVIAKNPEIKFLSPPRTWTHQVELTIWINELEDILERKKMWSPSIPMRPQIQIMRLVGLPIQLNDRSLITQNIQQTVIDLQPLVDFFS
jgi:hypothetical protein